MILPSEICRRKKPKRNGFKTIKLLSLLLRLIVLSLSIKAWKRLKSVASPKLVKRMVGKMTKQRVQVTDDDSRIPPMPDSKEEVGAGSFSPSTSSEAPTPARSDAVTEEFAGDLFEIPFKVWHVVDPRVPDGVGDRVKDGVAAPFARVLEKYGLGKIAKDEILVAYYITQAVATNLIIIRKAKKAELVGEAPVDG